MINEKQVTVETLSVMFDMLIGCHLIWVLVTRKLFLSGGSQRFGALNHGCDFYTKPSGLH